MATSADNVVECDPCQNRNVVTFCTKCREFYCTECSSIHQAFKRTRNPTQVFISPVDQNFTKTVTCDKCQETYQTQSAISVCVECRELYCHKCSTNHGKTKARRDHMIFHLSDKIESDNSAAFQRIPASSPKPDFSGAQVRKDPVVCKSPSKIKIKSVDETNALPEVIYCKEFSPRVPSDSGTYIFEVQRMLTLPDDQVVVLDWKNDKLKLFNADYQIIHYCDVDEFCLGLTSVNDTTVAVSGDNLISLYTFRTDKIQKSRSIKRDRMDGEMYDICYKDNKFVCLTYHNNNKWCIDVVNLEGHSKTIVTENRTLYPANHIVPGETNCFYVNTGTNEVRCLTIDGIQLWTVPVTHGPRGMSLVRGRLLVVRCGTGDVLQISLDGKLHEQPVLRELQTPYCICYQQKRNRILCSSFKPGSQINVYQID